jgi:hypothetical protein
MRRLLAAALALTALMWLPTATPPQIADAASVCTGWTSVRVPPTTIRVLRSSGASSGYVAGRAVQEVRPDRPGGRMAAHLAGRGAPDRSGRREAIRLVLLDALARRDGHAACYDVSDNNNDQIYQPESRTPSAAQLSAIEATWTKSVTKNGSFVMMGYRSGASVACGADADGYHLYQHSSLACANNGMTVDQILHVYFDPGVW